MEQLKLMEAEKQTRDPRYLPASVKREVWKRDGGRCVECGSKENLGYNHVIPFSKGGTNTAGNIQLLCEKCNKKKPDKI
ncbi:MAG: HNH endonuclease [Promethearchaeota archaeon]|nr:MAG: HNH endonuclease [Candidatus Lokiarchaeota archaeon]